jgi:hypothetical protein
MVASGNQAAQSPRHRNTNARTKVLLWHIKLLHFCIIPPLDDEATMAGFRDGSLKLRGP